MSALAAPLSPTGLALVLLGLALPLTVAGANFAWGLVLAALLVRAWSGNAPAWSAARGPRWTPLWLYLAAAVLTALFGMDTARSILSLRQDAHKLWLYALFSVAWAAEPGAPALFGLALGFAAAALVGACQALGAYAADGPWVRAHAFVHPVTFGVQACIGLLGVFCFLAGPQEPLGRPAYRRAAWILGALLALALILSNTRGALLGLTAGLAALGVAVPALRRKAFIGLLAVPVAFLIMERTYATRSLLAEFPELNYSTLSSSARSPQYLRLILWKAAWRMGLDHPWTGVGPNNFRAAFPTYQSGPVDGREASWGSAHNLYLHQFAERGSIGLAALASVLGALWWTALERVRRDPDAWNLWAFGATTAFLAVNLTEVAFQTELLWMLVFYVWSRAQAPRSGGSGRIA